MTIITVVVLWQPFVPDFATALTTTQGWPLWWYTHQTTIGLIHMAWALATVAFVLFAPRKAVGHTTRRAPLPDPATA